MALLTRLGLGAIALCASCAFSPSLDGRYACGAGGQCPPGLTCAADRVCRVADESADSESRDLGTGFDLPRDQARAPHADAATPSHDAATPDDLAKSSSPADLSNTCVPAVCSAAMCGMAPDGCGAKLNCKGDCKMGAFCGGGGVNLCGTVKCTPTSCAAGQCGFVSDGCANVHDCGPCD